MALCTALAGGPEVCLLQLAELSGRAPVAPEAVLELAGCSVSSAAWSPDGHLFALATQARLLC